MNIQTRFPVFTTVFCISYAVLYGFKLRTGLYYPRLEVWSWGPLGPGLGRSPVMNWYGWVGTAIVIGMVAALIIPGRWASRFWTPSWLAPVALCLFVVFHELHWFMD